MSQYYVCAEDLAAAIVGPFNSIDAALDHIKFCWKRGDSASMIINPSKDAFVWRMKHDAMYIPVEEDLTFQFPTA